MNLNSESEHHDFGDQGFQGNALNQFSTKLMTLTYPKRRFMNLFGKISPLCGIPSVKSNDAYLNIQYVQTWIHTSNLIHIFMTKCIPLMQKWQPNFTVRDLCTFHFKLFWLQVHTTGDKKVHASIYGNFLSTLQTCLIFHEYEYRISLNKVRGH